MPEIVADLLHRQTVIEKTLGGGVTQRMRAPALAGNAEMAEAAVDDVSDHVPCYGPQRSVQRQEQRPVGPRGTDLAQVADNRLWSGDDFVDSGGCVIGRGVFD